MGAAEAFGLPERVGLGISLEKPVKLCDSFFKVSLIHFSNPEEICKHPVNPLTKYS